MGFHQKEPPPSERLVESILVRHFGHESSIKIHVNGKEFRTEEHARLVAEVADEEVPGIGILRGSVWVTHQTVKHPGVVIYAAGQSVFGPSLFGIDHRGYRGETKGMSKRVVGRIELIPEGDHSLLGTGAWSLSSEFKNVEAWIGNKLDLVIERELSEHLERRVDTWLNDSITRKHYDKLDDAQKAATRQILVSRAKTYADGESSARSERVIARFVAKTMRTANLRFILQAVDEADDATIGTFANILGGADAWTLRQVATTATIVKDRAKALDELERVSSDGSYVEADIHKILASNPWIISDDFISYRSNRQIRTTLREGFGIETDDPGATTRPDFFFVLGDLHSEAGAAATLEDMRYLFVELKGPAQPLGLDQQTQATNDAHKFLHFRGGGLAHVWLIGTCFDKGLACAKEGGISSPVRYRYHATTYQELVQQCRRRLLYLAEANASKAEEVARKVVEVNAEQIAEMMT